MSTARLDRGTIISEGLQIGGNPGLATRARVFLNLVINYFERAHDWDYLEKEDTSLTTTIGQEFVDLSGIVDFRKIVSLWVEGYPGPLVMQPWSRIWSRVNISREKSNTGAPTQFALDRNGNRLILWPIPNAVKQLRLLYISEPPQPDTAVPATYDADIPAFPNHYVLVNAVSEFAKYWDTDSMLGIAQRLTEQTLEDAKMSEMAEGASNALVIKLDPSVHKQFRTDSSGLPFSKG